MLEENHQGEREGGRVLEAPALPTLLPAQFSPKLRGAVYGKCFLVLKCCDCVHPGGPSYQGRATLGKNIGDQTQRFSVKLVWVRWQEFWDIC